MGGRTWEQCLWQDLHIVPVADFNTGRINLLDIFAQDGKSYRLRSIVGVGDGKPFRRRALTRVGSVTTLGDMAVDDWEDLKKEISDDLKALEDSDFNTRETMFKKGADGNDRRFVVGAASKALIGLFGAIKFNFERYRTLEVEVSNPSYQRIPDNDLIGFIQGFDGDSPMWRPDIARIRMMKRKGTSLQVHTNSLHGTKCCWGTQEKHIELWIVTELKFGNIKQRSTRVGGGGANVNLPGVAELATVLPAAGGVNVTATDVRGSEIDAPHDPAANRGEILFGFKAIRVKFDEVGNYVHHRGDMGSMPASVTRGDEFNPNKSPNFHMDDFFETDSDDNFECVPLYFDQVTEDDDTSS